jgi:hypothetical protein
MKSVIRAGVLALLCAGVAQAATVRLTYEGMSDWESGVAVTGTGSFQTKPSVNVGAIGLSDLISFDFTFSFSYKGKVDTFQYDLSSLSCPPPFMGSECGFSAVLSATGVDSLELATDTVDAQFNWDQRLIVFGLDDAITANPDMPPLSSGTMTATLVPDDGNTVPEPAGLALAGLALGAGMLASRRRAR